ncbi:MAG: hypothetical protein IKX91_00090, partial [Firmicutes bacterium]|nr:hypothetical protein [Bacillota bacterium]
MSERKKTIPIVIGGSGYRDIPAADFACVKAAAKAELERLRAAYPASEIRLLVSLAAGGDTLLAEAAEELGIPFTAVLPLPAEEFLRDFEG